MFSIDFKKTKTFRKKPIKVEEILKDIKENQFTNIVDDWSVYEELATILCIDYNMKLANYRGYMKKGMNLRDFAEIRKSAILNSECKEFYDLHSTCKTREDVKKLRIRYLAPEFNILFPLQGYIDEDWQLHLIMWRTVANIEQRECIDLDFDHHTLMEDTPPNYRIKCYAQEVMRFRTDYDGYGNKLEKPRDITPLLIELGFM